MTHTVHFELLKKGIIIFHVKFTACQSFLWKNVNDFRYRIKWCTFNHLICPVQVGESNGEYRMDACVTGVRVDERTTDRVLMNELRAQHRSIEYELNHALYSYDRYTAKSIKSQIAATYTPISSFSFTRALTVSQMILNYTRI